MKKQHSESIQLGSLLIYPLIFLVSFSIMFFVIEEHKASLQETKELLTKQTLQEAKHSLTML